MSADPRVIAEPLSNLVSAVIPISERHDDLRDVYFEYKAGLDAAQRPYEIIYVLDGPRPQTRSTLELLQGSGEPLTIVCLAKKFGDSTALAAGIDQSRGDVIVTLPAFRQIEGSEIPKLLSALADSDVIVASRRREGDSAFNRLQSFGFSAIANWVSGLKLTDAGCEVRAMRREVARELPLYGDLHRFIPLLSHQRGFRVRQVELRQSQGDRERRVYAPGIYVRRLLDLLTVFFLVKFTKKPLRFFGLIGSSIFAAGCVATAWLIVERLLGGIALADRPALLLGVLLIVLGIQIVAIGLVGEIVIFAHGRSVRDFTVAETVEAGAIKRASRESVRH